MDLERFLEGQRESGGWDSQGAFTIAASKAREKLARFALKTPQFYIVKLVQAGMALGAARMRVDGVRNGLALWFDGPALESPVELLTALSGAEVADEGVRMLALGMNIALFAEPSTLSLHHWTGTGEGWALSFQGEEISTAPAPPRPSNLPSEGPLWLFSLQKSGYFLLRSPVEAELFWLGRCCGHVPIDFKVQGRRLAARPESSGVLESTAWRTWIVERHEVGGSSTRVEAPDREPGGGEVEEGWLRQRMFGGVTLWQRSDGDYTGEPAFCREAFFLPDDLDGADILAFVSHGVIVGRAKLALPGAGALALFDASLVNFDLSGFEVVKDERLDLVMARAGEVWMEMLRDVRPHLERSRGPLKERTQPEKGPGCCLLWFLFCSFEPMSWGIGLLTLGAWGAYRHHRPFEAQVPDVKGKAKSLERLDWLLATESWPHVSP